jgi:hypothetical protein
MQYVVLDTNAWINLVNGTEPSRLLFALHRGIIEEEVVVILPTIIVDEWNKGKHKLLSGGMMRVFDEIDKNFGILLKNIDKNSSSTLDASEVLPFDEVSEFNHWLFFKNLASDAKKGRREVEEIIKENAEIVEAIFVHRSTRIIQTKDESVLKAGKFAVSKKAPFSNKNSFADALILFTFIEYVRRNRLYYTHFITYNVDDFCERKMGQFFLHKDLAPELERHGIAFHQNVSSALSSIYNNIQYQNLELFSYLNEIRFYEAVSEAIEAEEELIFKDGACNHCSHPIHYHRIDLLDTRIANVPAQLELDFVKNMPSSSPDPSQLFNRITVGVCSYCETEYFACVNCEEINSVGDNDYYTRKECSSTACCMPYYISPGRWYENFECYLSDYFILTGKKICRDCSDLFQDDGSESDLCALCKEHYQDMLGNGVFEGD